MKMFSEIDELIQDICDDLQLKVPAYKFVDDDVLGTKLAACASDGSELLLRKGLQFHEYVFIIAHECRHLWQLKTGKHSPPTSKETYVNSERSISEYSRQECEIDANAYAQFICVMDYGFAANLGELPSDVKEEINKRAFDFIRLYG